MTINEQTITTDVLIIGGGLAGSFAAIKAKEENPAAQVLVLEQGVAGFHGRASYGTNIMRCVLDSDDHDYALWGTTMQTDYMIDQEYAADCIAASQTILEEIMKYGGDYDRGWDGKIKWMKMVTDVAGFYQRQAIWNPFGSYKHVNKIVAAAKAAGAKYRDRTLVTELLTNNGKCIGACGIDSREGTFLIFRAKAVVLASADYHAAGCNMVSFTGDGMAMAQRAGVALRGMEFGRICFGAIWPSYGEQMVSANERMARTFRNTEEVKQRIVNALGEEFSEKYEWTYVRGDRMNGGPTWKNYIPAIMKEMQEGRGPCFLDMGGAVFEIGFAQRASAQTGGVMIDRFTHTSLPGLFASGNGSDMCGGMHYSIPYNLLGSSYTGRVSGTEAARYAAQHSIEELDGDQVSRYKAEAYAPLENENGTTEAQLRCSMIDIWPYLDYRTEETLTTAYNRFSELEQDAANMSAFDQKGQASIHELAKALKIRNVVQLGEAEALAALERRESRIEHYRADYPYMDNDNYAKWVIVKGVGDDMHSELMDIPFERYKYRPEPGIVDRLAPKGSVELPKYHLAGGTPAPEGYDGWPAQKQEAWK